jgi:hypothetical protein
MLATAGARATAGMVEIVKTPGTEETSTAVMTLETARNAGTPTSARTSTTESRQSSIENRNTIGLTSEGALVTTEGVINIKDANISIDVNNSRDANKNRDEGNSRGYWKHHFIEGI